MKATWKTSEKALSAVFTFPDFKTAFSFMTEVAFHAECQNHHPTWTNTYNTVEILLTTHDAGGLVTDKDHRLMRAIDRIYEKIS